MSVQFSAEEEIYSLLGSCEPRNVSFYIKPGAPPVINPDGSKFPKSFRKIKRNEIYYSEFLSDKKSNYINITAPAPGQYIMATFLQYEDPRYLAITQQGLNSQCYCYVSVKVYVKKTENPLIITDENKYVASGTKSESIIYKFFVPKDIDTSILILEEFSPANKNVILKAQVNMLSVPDSNNNLGYVELNDTQRNGEILFTVAEETWHYLKISFNNTEDNNMKSEENSTVTFKLRFFSSLVHMKENFTKYFANETIQIIETNNSIVRSLQSQITDVTYKQYDLIKDSVSDPFVFSYILEQEVDSTTPVGITIDNNVLSVLKFHVNAQDIGGTMQFILAFSSVLNKKLPKEPSDYVVVACIRPHNLEVPDMSGNCTFNGLSTASQIVINSTLTNSSISIPYPETGVWYASFRLFCDKCSPCSCSEDCKQQYNHCLVNCLKKCVMEECDRCEDTCRANMNTMDNCTECSQCEGPCKKSNKTCSTTAVFDINSRPCLSTGCGKNGKCVYMITDGIGYSTCVCYNKYRGWDCRDDTLATPYYMVVIELLLLVLSNLAFLPSVVFALRRKYYTESLAYFSICFFSSFYHACDAGENVLTYCIINLSVLQFADFFCAVLSIWLTLIAMADLPRKLTSIFHILGAIVVAVCTTVNKTAIWVFAMPIICGAVIIAISWYFKYKKVNSWFCKKVYAKIYLPMGIVWAILGLIIFGVLETEDNYKYLHSLWHIIMAVVIIIVLPREDTFQPNNLIGYN
ncbi:uncharacterized protein LOC109603011 isoform X2 [Aethina tumida]|nr:uncharacterized protein LOC109603011 isoform X2 [Aethina tumida]